MLLLLPDDVLMLIADFGLGHALAYTCQRAWLGLRGRHVALGWSGFGMGGTSDHLGQQIQGLVAAHTLSLHVECRRRQPLDSGSQQHWGPVLTSLQAPPCPLLYPCQYTTYQRQNKETFFYIRRVTATADGYGPEEHTVVSMCRLHRLHLRCNHRHPHRSCRAFEHQQRVRPPPWFCPNLTIDTIQVMDGVCPFVPDPVKVNVPFQKPPTASKPGQEPPTGWFRLAPQQHPWPDLLS